MKKHILQFFASLFIICLLTIPFNSCNQTEVLPLKTELQEVGSFVLPADHADLVTLGPMQFTRGTADPTIIEIQMNPDDFKCHIPPYTLYVVNGELDGNYRVTSALVSVDGTVIFSQSDFNKKVEQLNQDVEITESSNIRVELRGKPGTYIHVYITGVKGDCCSPSGTFVDERDGQVYKCVTIGDQVWMAENLRASVYLNGDEIPNITDKFEWISLDSDALCAFNNNLNNVPTYGYLYNWYAIADQRGLCPAGWHIPTNEEWTTLIDYLGGSEIAGGKMKQAGTIYWKSPNIGADNSSGFTALPGGFRYPRVNFEPTFGFNNFFSWANIHGDWWSSSELDQGNAFGIYLDTSWAGIILGSVDKKHGYSVRCIMD